MWSYYRLFSIGQERFSEEQNKAKLLLALQANSADSDYAGESYVKSYTSSETSQGKVIAKVKNDKKQARELMFLQITHFVYQEDPWYT